MTPEILLTVHFMIQPHALEVSYAVTNRSAALIWLTNHGVRVVAGKGPIADRHQAEVSIDGGQVQIAKRLPRVPADRFVTPRPHYVTPLAAGQSFRETFQLPLPLVQSIPYQDARPGKPAQTETLTFTIGLVRATAELAARPRDSNGEQVWLLGASPDFTPTPARPDPVLDEQLLTSPPVSLRVPMLRPR